MPELPKVSPPPAMGNCVTTTGVGSADTVHQLIRSGDGKIRVDSGNISVITDPATQRTILLDHLNKEAKSLSAVAMPQTPGIEMPAMPQLTPPGLPPGVPVPANMNVQDLGKKLIEGEEAEGKRIVMQPPKMPAIPAIPTMPGMASRLQRPGIPTVPQPPQVPTVTEIWTNPTLHLPVLTQVKGPFGEQICKCKNQAIPEPDPSLFQVPKDYKDLTQAPSIPPVPPIPTR